MAGVLFLANAAGEFEQGLAAIGAVNRATTRQLDMLREAAINAGIQTQFSPTEAIEGLQSLAIGQTAEQATRTLVPVLDLAAGSLGHLAGPRPPRPWSARSTPTGWPRTTRPA